MCMHVCASEMIQMQISMSIMVSSVATITVSVLDSGFTSCEENANHVGSNSKSTVCLVMDKIPEPVVYTK